MGQKAKGKRPVYFDAPQLDKLLAIVMALAGEVAARTSRHPGTFGSGKRYFID